MANRSAVKLNSSQPDFLQFNDLACETVGGKVVFATDEWFASAHNLLKKGPPEFIASAFTDFGKWMDGWETRRKRIPGHDWCIVQLGVPGVIHGFDVDTSYFTGNYAPSFSVQAACLAPLVIGNGIASTYNLIIALGKGDMSDRTGTLQRPNLILAGSKAPVAPPLEPVSLLHYSAKTYKYKPSLSALSLDGDRTGMAASESQFKAVSQLHSENWEEIVPVTKLSPGYADSCHNYFSVTFPHRVTHIRLNMYPDGGIARLRVYGIGQRDWSTAPSQEEVDLVALVNGGVCVGYSDAHFGHPRNMIGLGRADNMADGWETARRLDRPKVLKVDERGILQVPGFEWAVFRLGHLGVINNIEIDTNHFKGNFPDSCQIEACQLTPEQEQTFMSRKWSNGNGPIWRKLLPPQKLKPHYRHFYSGDSVLKCGSVTHVRMLIAPDGGVSRLRLWGQPFFSGSSNPRTASKL